MAVPSSTGAKYVLPLTVAVIVPVASSGNVTVIVTFSPSVTLGASMLIVAFSLPLGLTTMVMLSLADL